MAEGAICGSHHDLSFGLNAMCSSSGRWGKGLTSDQMKDCRWLRPVLVGQVESVEWAPDDHRLAFEVRCAQGGSAGARATAAKVKTQESLRLRDHEEIE